MVPEKFSKKFNEYIKLDCDRLLFLQKYLLENGIKSSVISLNGTNNLCVNLPNTSYDPTFKTKIVVSHYDRVKNTFGANDNSAANFSLLDFAIRLSKNPSKIHNTRIFFTDGEEKGIFDIKNQGAYKLGGYFSCLGLQSDLIFTFDACGKGEIAILGSVGVLPTTYPDSKNLQKKLNELYAISKDLLKNTIPEKWYSLPLPMSDNVGFLASGLSSVCFCTAPIAEATNYAKGFMNGVMSLPKTWGNFHSLKDNLDNIDEYGFETTAKILDAIAELKIMA